MKMPTPEKEHTWLKKLVGDWTYQFEASMKPGDPPTKLEGPETVRAIGDVWIQGEQSGQMPDGVRTTALLTLGFDPQRKCFVGTWLGSMMTYLWVYEGSLDETGKVLTLNTEGPDMEVEGRMCKYREVIEFKTDNHRTFTSYVQKQDGTWQQLMAMEHRRK